MQTTTTTMIRNRGAGLKWLCVLVMMGLAAAHDRAHAATSPATDAEAAPDMAAADAGFVVTGWKGYLQGELAYTYAEPVHWSEIRGRLEFQTEGRFTPALKWKFAAGAYYDAAFDGSNFFPPEVENNQRKEFIAREVFLDYSTGDFDFRIGRQNIIWGEVVSLFVADVVSAKDLREFVLPDFDLIRIPQWAARAEYFKGDFHAEALWIPYMSYDNIGKPGADFYPYPPAPPPGYATAFENEVIPLHNSSNWAYGARASYLMNGWDAALFYYRSTSAYPTFYREIVNTPDPTFVYTPKHDRIWQAGATVSKDFENFVFKLESVYTSGLGYNVNNLSDPDGVVEQNTFEYIASVDFPFADEQRLNLQFFQRFYTNHDPDIVPPRIQTGGSLLWTVPIAPRWTGELLVATSFDRTDWMVRPRIIWDMGNNWRLRAGVDTFGGWTYGVFGRFGDRDRVYAEVKYSF